MALDPLAKRVADRYRLAKSVQLLPDYQKALTLYHQTGDPSLMVALIQQVSAIILPGEGSSPPSWFNALGTAKRNTLKWLYKEGQHLLGLLAPSHPGEIRDAERWRSYVIMQLEAWGKKLRTLEIATQAEDEERNLKHGPFTVVKMPGISKADLEGSLGALDAASDKIRGKFPHVLYGFVYLSPHLSTKRAASYVYASDTIQLDVHARKRFSDMQTLIHEFGHRYDHKFLRKDLRDLFWKLSTEKVMETILYDEKLRSAVADEALQIARARRDGTVMPVMSADLERWVRSPFGVGPYIKTIMTNFLSGKIDERKAHEEIKGPRDQEVETGKMLHAPLHVTPYGATSPVENFADAFAFYVLGLAMPPELAEIMAQL